jgi:hypothetical protein
MGGLLNVECADELRYRRMDDLKYGRVFEWRDAWMNRIAVKLEWIN